MFELLNLYKIGPFVKQGTHWKPRGAHQVSGPGAIPPLGNCVIHVKYDVGFGRVLRPDAFPGANTSLLFSQLGLGLSMEKYESLNPHSGDDTWLKHS